MMKVVFAPLLFVLLGVWTTTTTTDAFTTSSSLGNRNRKMMTTTTTATTLAAVSRRDALLGSAFGLASLVAAPQMASAGTEPPSQADIERIKIGYKQIEYLLDNFEQETTVCRENGGECKRDADPVRKALGLRSTTDPLFQIDKVFNKVKNMDLDPDKLESFFDATENWNTAMNMSNSMAFISQFGEYNPGGGKDEVLKYLEESRKQVVLAKDALRTILDCLGEQV
mmetsp:Transcript_17838/g.30335  ORF Transcript_17838/g.30335 Transcript_17838/m.30335 type:complete len:226 (+) Transcript_17838:3-680(+)